MLEMMRDKRQEMVGAREDGSRHFVLCFRRVSRRCKSPTYELGFPSLDMFWVAKQGVGPCRSKTKALACRILVADINL